MKSDNKGSENTASNAENLDEKSPDSGNVDGDISFEGSLEPNEVIEELADQEEPDLVATRILELTGEIGKLNDLIIRERAEFTNYRKRTAQESLQLEGRTAGKILQEILPAFDAFDQLLTSSSSEGSIGKFLEGAALIKRQLWQVFENYGVEEINPLNIAFDPQSMEALSVSESGDVTTDQVTQVYQKGYKFKDRVLRPARVAVIKPKSTGGSDNR